MLADIHALGAAFPLHVFTQGLADGGGGHIGSAVVDEGVGVAVGIAGVDRHIVHIDLDPAVHPNGLPRRGGEDCPGQQDRDQDTRDESYHTLLVLHVLSSSLHLNFTTAPSGGVSAPGDRAKNKNAVQDDSYTA